jgi:hypothetical protein
MPRPTIITDLRSVARSHTDTVVNVLVGVIRSPKAPPSARVAAAGMLLDRGWGRAPQEHTGPGGGDIRVTIRQLIDTAAKKPEEPDGSEDQGS